MTRSASLGEKAVQAALAESFREMAVHAGGHCVTIAAAYHTPPRQPTVHEIAYDQAPCG